MSTPLDFHGHILKKTEWATPVVHEELFGNDFRNFWSSFSLLFFRDTYGGNSFNNQEVSLIDHLPYSHDIYQGQI